MAEWIYVVNKTGKSLPVYDAEYFVTKKNKIGTILPRETYILANGSDLGPEIYFRNSAGKLTYGFGELSAAWQDPVSSANLTDYPYTRNPNTLYLRKSRKIYRPNGTVFMTLAAGKRVKIRTQSSDPNGAGSSMNWLMIIDGYETSNGNFSSIEGSHGFIDMGLKDTGSGWQYIPVYGSW